METYASKPGVVSHLFEKLVAPAPEKHKAKIALVGIGFEIHFDWESILKSYATAKGILGDALPAENFEVLTSDEPIQTKEDMLVWLEQMKKQDVDGIIIYQASYIAGDLAATTARWFVQNPIPVLSWSHDEATGGRLSNNRLCGQNFMLNILNSSNVKYSWIFESPESPTIGEHILPFAKAVYAKASLNQRVIGMIGGFRVPGFYDCELNEISLLKRFGLLVDRVDFETIWKHGEKFKEEDINEIREALINHPSCKFNNVTDERTNKCIRLALAVTDYSRENKYIGIGLKNWPELFDHYDIAGDGAGALIQDMGIPVADESDMGALVTMVVLNQVSLEQCVPTLVDLSLADAENNKLGFWHCGGAPTKLMKPETGYEVRNHSILENYSEESSTGMLLEFLHNPGEITVAKYMYPHAAKVLTWEGDIKPSEMAFRGSYAETEPKDEKTADLLSTILNNGCDHHWIIGRGYMGDELAEFNHWVDVEQMSIDKSKKYLYGNSK